MKEVKISYCGKDKLSVFKEISDFKNLFPNLHLNLGLNFYSFKHEKVVYLVFDLTNSRNKDLMKNYRAGSYFMLINNEGNKFSIEDLEFFLEGFEREALIIGSAEKEGVRSFKDVYSALDYMTKKLNA